MWRQPLVRTQWQCVSCSIGSRLLVSSARTHDRRVRHAWRRLRVPTWTGQQLDRTLESQQYLRDFSQLAAEESTTAGITARMVEPNPRWGEPSPHWHSASALVARKRIRGPLALTVATGRSARPTAAASVQCVVARFQRLKSLRFGMRTRLLRHKFDCLLHHGRGVGNRRTVLGRVG
jgi:hypothetical protein